MSHKNNQAPIFILGSPRSGTTFVVTLLNRHSSLFGFNETLFYEYRQTENEHIISNLEQLNSLSQHLLERLTVRTNSDNTNFGCTLPQTLSEQITQNFKETLNTITLPVQASIIFEKFMQIAAKQSGKERWVEKTPNHVFYVADILKDFPDAKFLHISRNPYAYLVSYKYSPYTVNNKIKRGKLYHPIVTSILWNNAEKSIDHAKSLIDSSQILSIRYEDIIKDTGKYLKDICQFLNIPNEENMHKVEGSNSSFKKGKKELNIIETAVCSLICKKNIKKYHYELKTSSLVGMIMLLPAIATLPIFLLLAFTTQKNKIKGSLKHYITTRILLNKSGKS